MNAALTNLSLLMLMALVMLNAWMFIQQPRMLFFPDKKLVATPNDWQLQYEDVSFQSQDGVELHGWYIPAANAEQVLLFFHGNAGNISHRKETIEIFHRLGLNVFIVDYRGYGRSQGKPSETGFYADARAAWQYLLEDRQLSAQQIIIFGRSLGGGPAIKLAGEVRPRALVVEATFGSIRSMAKRHFPILSRLVYLRYHFNNELNIRSVQAPLLVLHSPDDEIIPFSEGERLYRQAHEPKRMIQLRGGHNDSFMVSEPAYSQAWRDFLDSI